MVAEPPMRGIHAGAHGEADSLFLQKGVIAVGWHEMGDLGGPAADRESFKEQYRATYPEAKPGAVGNHAGLLFRFVHEMAAGDIVVYPRKADRTVHVGRIVGDYEYVPDSDAGFPNRRKAEWLKSAPRTHFSQGCLYGIGSATTLFSVGSYDNEFTSLLEGEPPVAIEGQDETVSWVAESINETTRDFILKTLSKNLKGHPFATFVADLLSAMGYRTRVSPEGPDGGIDILAHKDELGFEPPIVKVQVKSTSGNVGDPETSALYGKVGPTEYGLLVTLGGFTTPAKSFAGSRTNLRLIDGEELVDLILEHYEDLGSTYKGMIPLRRVYVPQVLLEQ